MNQIELHTCSGLHYVKPYLCLARKQAERTQIRQKPCMYTLVSVREQIEFMQILNLHSSDLGHKPGWKLTTRRCPRIIESSCPLYLFIFLIIGLYPGSLSHYPHLLCPFFCFA